MAGMLAAIPATAGASTIEDAQIWTALSAQGSIKGNLIGQIDLNVRGIVDQRRVSQTLSRVGVGYRVDNSISLSIGYGHIENYRTNLPNVNEERLHQQILWTVGKIGNATLTTRLRLEQRFVRPGKDVGWRYRQQFRFQQPLKKDGPSLIVSVEPFFALNSTDWGARSGFDQVRAMAGVAIPVSKTATIETGYLAQYVRGASSDRLNHIVPITLALRF